MNRTRKQVNRCENPYENAGILSRWSFWWMADLFREGIKRPLSDRDLYKHHKLLASGLVTYKFSKEWEDERKRKSPSVIRLILRCYGTTIIPLQMLYTVIEMASKILQPFLLGSLVTYFAVDQTSITERTAYLCAAGIVICSLLPVLCYSPLFFYISLLSTQIRLGLSGLIYQRSLKISKNASNDGLRARAINILSSDLGRIDDIHWVLDDIIKGPLHAIIIGYLMYREIGLSAVISVIFLLSFTPLQLWAAKRVAHYGEQAASSTDLRIKLMNEIIQGIQVIKMYTWERYFAKRMNAVRRAEMHSMRGIAYVHATLKCTVVLAPLAAFMALVTYVYWGNVLTAKRVFMVSCYFGILSDFMVDSWPTSLILYAEAYVSACRVTEFLLGEDRLEPQETTTKVHTLRIHTPLRIERLFDPGAEKKRVMLSKVTASWNKDYANGGYKAGIVDFNFDIQDDTLAAVVGPVGAGKSTFLNVLLGEVEIYAGEVLVHGKVSYASQEAWIFEGTIRDNIIFVEDYDEHRYRRVMRVCALERDLELLPYGDLTLVGERGVNLSGGQKARVNLARAVYRKADIYLLDDPLSAVDTHVGKLIFEQCMQKFLAGKIRILVTHQVQYLFKVQRLLMMRGGRIAIQGSYQDLQKSKEFKFLQQTHQPISSESESNNVYVSRHLSRSDSETSMEEFPLRQIEKQLAEAPNQDQQPEGVVKFCVYKFYFEALGNPSIVLLIAFLLVFSRVLLTALEYFLSRWVIWEEKVATFSRREFELSEQSMNVTIPLNHEKYQRYEWISFYSIILVTALIVYIARTFGYISMCLSIALKLHDRLFRQITRATMHFFNTNSSGKILNRFSKDVNMVDTNLYFTLLDCLVFFIDILGAIVIVCMSNFWLLLPTGLIVVCLIIMRHIYLSLSRSLTRIENTARSPVYTLTNQTFQGLTTIRALEAAPALQEEFNFYQNENTSAWTLILACRRAFAFWLDLICVLYVGVVTFSFLALCNAHFSSGDVGLAIIHSMSLVGLCQFGLRDTADLENEITSVERIMSYIRLPSEPHFESSENHKLNANWPSQGCIEFEKLIFRYSLQDAYVLHGLSFVVAPHEKIGIVGRTGAGKSSIVQSLFRLGYNEGIIRIDGVDIEKMGLHDLRDKISIIPQDPVLFAGTLRYNLDPTDKRSNIEIWQALADVELHEYVSILVDSINHQLFDGGSNFSVGQRQLVCLARALLRNNKILILDEATANVDPETDILIQNTIRKKFAHCTVLTIAHRLQTIMDSDRVLVMDAGHAVEFDHPHKLLQKRHGHLTQLVKQTGTMTSATLRTAAEQSYKRQGSRANIKATLDQHKEA